MSMPINSEKGTKVVYTATGGHDLQIETANKYLKKGQIYTVLRTDIHNFHTDVYLQEVPDISFNSVHFDEVRDSNLLSVKNKIISIREKIPRPANLPDGHYVGTWSGYMITVSYNDKYYELQTEHGIRGSTRVVVNIKDQNPTFDELKN